MIDYKSFHYDEYFIMLPDGKTVSTSRKECFKNCGKAADNNQFKQRWYFSVDKHMAIRLPRNELGEKWYHWNAAELRNDNRTYARERSCVAQRTWVKCPIACEDCKFKDECTSKDREYNGRHCNHKCNLCDSFVLHTIMIGPAQADPSEENNMLIEAVEVDNTEAVDVESSVDIECEYINIETEQELETALYKVISTLSEKDKKICDLLSQKKSNVQIADELNCTENAIRKRKKKLQTIFENAGLRKFL